MRLAVRGVLGALVVWVVVHTAGGLGDTARALQRVDVVWFVGAVVCGAARIALYGLQLRMLGNRRREVDAGLGARIALVVYGFGAVTPASPAEGLVIATSALHRRGVARRDAVMMLAFSEWFTQRTFYLLGATDFIVALAIDRHLTLANDWPYLAGAGFVLGVLALSARAARSAAFAERVAVVLAHLRLRHRPGMNDVAVRAAGARWWEDAMHLVGTRGRRFRLVVVSLGAVLADALALWCACRGAHAGTSMTIAILAMAVGQVATWIPLLPAGLGLVEAAVPALLHHFGTPYARGLAATIVYRGAAVALPALAGTAVVVALRRPGARAEPPPTPG